MEAERTRSSLLLRIRNTADNESWGEFYEAYHPLLLKYVRSRGIDPNDADDIVQDLFLSKLRPALAEFEFDRSRGRFRTWLFQVTINAIRDWARRKQHRVAAAGGSAEYTGPVVPSVTEELSREWDQFHHEQIMRLALQKCRGAFEARTWACFEQRMLHNRSGGEVAGELGLNVNAVYTNAHRVLEKIREFCLEYDEVLDAGSTDDHGLSK